MSDGLIPVTILGYLRVDRSEWDAELNAARAKADEVAPPKPEPEHGIKVREVPGGVVLDVPNEVRKQLLDFGWLPPDGA